MDILALRLKLDRPECLRGESAFFALELQNVTNGPAEVPSLDPDNRTVKLLIGAGEGDQEPQYVAHQLSARERDGLYQHEMPEEPEMLSLRAKQSVELRGDLLSWFGELPPGTHQITATYYGNLLLAESPPVTLRVVPSAPRLSSVPRYGLQDRAAPLAAAWAHRDARELLLFYQLQSPYLPRNVRHAIRLGGVKDLVSLQAACVSHREPERGHLYWQTPDGKFFFAAVDLQSGQAGEPVEAKLPFRGQCLDSALSMPDGTLMVPFADEAKGRVAVLRVADGEVTPYLLDLGAARPLGPYVCFWEGAARLHFAWAKEGGRQVDYAMLPLDEPDAGFARRSVHVANDPIVWLDAYLDEEAALEGLPYFEEHMPEDQRAEDFEPQPPKVMLWCVTRGVGRLACTRVGAADSQSKAAASFGTQPLRGLRVLGSVVTHRYELALLLADAADRLYYASTVRKAMLPVEQLAGRPVALGSFPALMTACGAALEPWVHLRYVQDGEVIQYVRLEPADEPDPTEPEPEPEEEEEAEASPESEEDEDAEDLDERAPEGGV
jgi:hypothetical protein